MDDALVAEIKLLAAKVDALEKSLSAFLRANALRPKHHENAARSNPVTNAIAIQIPERVQASRTPPPIPIYTEWMASVSTLCQRGT